MKLLKHFANVPDLLSSMASFVVALAKDRGIQGLGTAVPGINAIIVLHKHWNKKKAGYKSLVEECEKYGVDLSKYLEGEFSENEIPKKELERATSRARAEIDFPDLVRYLEPQFNILENDHKQLFTYFGELQKLLQGRYPTLTPIETDLQDPPFLAPKENPKKYSEPQFFRREGPVAVDFSRGYVVARKEVDTILDHLKSGDVLLFGDAATGKTVITREVAYRWFKEHKRPVRILGFKAPKSVDFAVLSNHIENFRENEPEGLLIIEDAHLQESLVNKLLSQDMPRLLITSRRAQQNLDPGVMNYFENVNFHRISLTPFEPAENIIARYFEVNQDKGWELTQALKRNLLEVSQKSLWVLSYALKSLDGTKGKVISIDSIDDEVKKDFLNITRLNEGHPRQCLFPCILVALSVLYRYEIPTDHRFLCQVFSEKNDIPKDVVRQMLTRLFEMGEVTVSNPKGHDLYGLPHSALGELYFRQKDKWEEADEVCGNEEAFLCDYITSDKAGNALSLMTSYQSVPALKFIQGINLTALGQRISAGDDLWGAGLCIERIYEADEASGKELCKKINKEALARNIETTNDLGIVGGCIERIYRADEVSGKELWEKINKEALARNIETTNDLGIVGLCIGRIYRADEASGKELWEKINKEALARNIETTDNFWNAGLCIVSIYRADEVSGKELWEKINKEALARIIETTDNLWKAGLCIQWIYRADEVSGKELSEKINKEALARNIETTNDLGIVGLCIGSIYQADEVSGKELSEKINKEALARIIETTDNLGGVGVCIEWIYRADEASGKELWEKINKEVLARNIETTNDLEIAGWCIGSIYQADEASGKELWEKINKEVLARNIETTNDLGIAGVCIGSIYQADEASGKELWEKIDKEVLARNIETTNDLGIVGVCIGSIYQADEASGKELLEKINKEALARIIETTDDLGIVGECIETNT